MLDKLATFPEKFGADRRLVTSREVDKLRCGYESRLAKYDDEVLELVVRQNGPPELLMRAQLKKKNAPSAPRARVQAHLE